MNPADQSTDQALAWIRRIVILGIEAEDKDQGPEFAAAAHAFAMSLTTLNNDAAVRLMASIPVLVRMLREVTGEDKTLQ